MDNEQLWQPDDAGKRIGVNLRQFRTAKGWSIESFARQIEVSKVTLIKIEQGKGNPTLSILWKIANGLNMPITSLLTIASDVSIARSQKATKLKSSDEVFTAEPLFQSQGFELYRGYLEPESEYLSEAHQDGVMEFVTVMSGQLTVEVDDKRYRLEEYDSIRFNGDRPHQYGNPSDSVAVLHFVISY